MSNHKLKAALWTALAMQLLGGVAGATTLTATATPSKAGTPQSPQPLATSQSLTQVYPGTGGNARSAMVKLVQSLPADFTTTLSSYGTCSASVVVHGDNKPNCPAASVVGSVTTSAFVPALMFDTNSDQGYIFKLGNNHVRAWVHVAHPQPAGIVADGIITPGAAPFGPVITWDFKPIADGAQAGVEIRVNAIAFTWGQSSGASSPTGSAHQLSVCNAKARRIKNKKARNGALHHCASLYPKSAGPTATKPFASTGCTTGSWPFSSQLTFNDNTTQTANTTVACTKAAGDSPSPQSPAAANWRSRVLLL
jgi:hypothetical protein